MQILFRDSATQVSEVLAALGYGPGFHPCALARYSGFIERFPHGGLVRDEARQITVLPLKTYEACNVRWGFEP